MSYNLSPLADRVTTILRTIPRPGAPFGERRSWIAMKNAAIADLIMLAPDRDRRIATGLSPTGTERRSTSPDLTPADAAIYGRTS